MRIAPTVTLSGGGGVSSTSTNQFQMTASGSPFDVNGSFTLAAEL
jgi:hypothetical protein